MYIINNNIVYVLFCIRCNTYVLFDVPVIAVISYSILSLEWFFNVVLWICPRGDKITFNLHFYFSDDTTDAILVIDIVEGIEQQPSLQES